MPPIPAAVVPPAAQIQVDALPEEPFVVQPISLFRDEAVRAMLAVMLLLLLTATIIWAFVKAGGGGWKNAKELLQIVLPIGTALLGSATGFYFAAKAAGG